MTDDNPEIARVTRSKEQARTGYNRLSRWYDLMASGSERKMRDAGLKMLSAGPGERILEIGFGTGRCIVALAQAVGDTGKVYGIDISDGMLGETMKRVSMEGLDDRVQLKRGDAVSLPYGDESFDAIFMSFTLELFDTPEIPVVLGECLRVLKAGGRLVTVSISAIGGNGTVNRIYGWAHRSIPNYVDCRPIYSGNSITNAGFSISDDELLSMWGLPVEVVLAVKQKQAF